MRRALLSAVLAFGPFGYSLSAQIPLEEPGLRADIAFEIVSIREDPAVTRTEAGQSILSMHPGGQFTALNVTVAQLARIAYDALPYQLVGGPDWVNTQLFDILAKAPEDFAMGETRAMMRRLLTDRFNLRVEREVRELQVYSLEWLDARRRPGLWLRRPSAACDRGAADPPEVMVGPIGGRRAPANRGATGNTIDPECSGRFGWVVSRPGVSHEWFHLRRRELRPFLGYLESRIGRPVLNNTGLSGEWDLDLKFDPLYGQPGADDIGWGSIVNAVREQLSLKLEPRDAPVEALVIQSLDRPTPN